LARRAGSSLGDAGCRTSRDEQYRGNAGYAWRDSLADNTGGATGVHTSNCERDDSGRDSDRCSIVRRSRCPGVGDRRQRSPRRQSRSGSFRRIANRVPGGVYVAAAPRRPGGWCTRRAVDEPQGHQSPYRRCSLYHYL